VSPQVGGTYAFWNRWAATAGYVVAMVASEALCMIGRVGWGVRSALVVATAYTIADLLVRRPPT
jgi:hypothetical protein